MREYYLKFFDTVDDAFTDGLLQEPTSQPSPPPPPPSTPVLNRSASVAGSPTVVGSLSTSLGDVSKRENERLNRK